LSQTLSKGQENQPKRPQLLFIAPLPYPLTGHSLAAQVFLSAAQSEYNVTVVDLKTEKFQVGPEHIWLTVSRLGRVRRHVGKSDVIYFTISESILGNIKDLCIYAICGSRLPRLIVHLHGGAGLRRILQNNPILGPINRFFLNRVGGIVLLGPSHISMFSKLSRTEHIHLVPNFASSDLFACQDDIPKKFNTPGPLRLLFLSNMLSGKGFWELLEGFSKLPEPVRRGIELDFAGAFPADDEERRFRQAISMHPEVRFHGSVTGAAKRDLLQRAHIFCLPTYYAYEGQPISILEAYAAGCAVMTTMHSGIPDIFVPGQNGIAVGERSVSSVTQALLTAFCDRSSLLSYALTNNQAARTQFTVDIFNEKLLSIHRLL
jgi:glycosyltransferase involved in cell wall biosynthesis